jgi:hypothetical protein
MVAATRQNFIARTITGGGELTNKRFCVGSENSYVITDGTMTPPSGKSLSRARFVWGLCLLSPVAAAALLYLALVPSHPPGFSIDESSICYNAYTVSETGRGEYGNAWPLFFRAFGEYKSPTFIYLLAALFRIIGPSIAAARLFSASFGILSGLLLGYLAWRMTRRWVTAISVTIIALLTPWLFESSRLVFEVAMYPALVALFLVVVWHASRGSRFNGRDVLVLAAVLALLTYSYSIGRLLAPLLAVGLALFLNRERWSGVVATWILYGLLLVPLLIFHQKHPDALTGRFKAITYFKAGDSAMTSLREFTPHYLENVNPWRWLVTGEGDIRDHLQGTGALLAGSVLLAAIGLLIVLREYRRDAWWRFLLYCLLVAPIPASLTSNPFPQLRLAAFPVFFLVLTIPAVGWLTEAHRGKRVLLAAVLVLVVVQGIFFQWRYHSNAPSLWYVFDGRFAQKVLAPALVTDRSPIALLDEPGRAGYIHALWYGLLSGTEMKRFVRVPWGDRPPPGSVVISTETDCRDCRLIARALNYIVYLVPPYPNDAMIAQKRLASFRADIVCENPPAALHVGQKATLKFLIRNTSASEWPAVGETGSVVLQSRWRNSTGSNLADQDAEQRLPYDIEPGDTVGLALDVTLPLEPGDYWLEIDLVQKQITRFSEQGSTPWSCQVKVTTEP